MSLNTPSTELPCEHQSGCGAIERVVTPKDKDLGGFSVRRTLPTRELRSVGPWVFFDHMGPASFAAGTGINVRPHPHINLATVTYLFEGEILHRDSLGSLQPIQPGDVNLMVAGRGIVHSERERPEVTAQPHGLHGLQLWLALPEADEETQPAFYHYPAKSIPQTQVGKVPVRVIMGEAYGQRSPVKTFAETLYLEARLSAGQSLTLPVAQQRALYLVSGGVKVGETELSEHAMAVLAPEAGVTVTAETDSLVALIGGEAMPPRYMEWNFVSSSKDRIAQAKADWQAGRFPLVPGDEEEQIPLP
ncbi:pirin family protein [Ferrimonas balearica]|uniref:pirin family protein n=1 Tax=Ferrimonas balearica TaxID=44012 RepID=UPI001C958068|nr:pirin family protein [Ferrimonas balearica]MBY5980681.1 pirin family protein [Ferrimonas balearica]